MLDIKFIRDNPDLVKQAAQRKRILCDVDLLLKVDADRRRLQQEIEKLNHDSREMGQQMALYRNPKSDWYKRAVAGGISPEEIKNEAAKLQEALTDIKNKGKTLQDQESEVLAQFQALMLTAPQPPAPEVPTGADETENVEMRREGELPAFDFEPKDHVQLGMALGIIDVERGVKLAGTRNYCLKGDGALLHQAILRLGYDLMLARGYTPVTVPVLVREAAMVGTGYFPAGRDQAYLCERDEMSLVGTAEVPLTSLHGDEILDQDQLPLKMFALSTCFRREAGAAGKDTYGLYRVHLFDKVEQVVICRNDEALSIALHQEILANAEAVLQALELPYRVVNVCTGDLGQGQVQKFDIETWMPSRNAYSETHSASRFYEFQARRLNLRYRDEHRKVQFCHTLNNTVIASPRALIPVLEVHQRADGSIRIPKALRPYMGGREQIGP